MIYAYGGLHSYTNTVQHVPHPIHLTLYNNYHTSYTSPPGCYDTIDGYYDPKTHMIYSHGDKREELRAPGPDEIDFILTCCRVGK
ncbi:hypothetical protein EON63_07255 [archaeon]|nr:MAG: hypothetical protein EON63_07255 [archaeon]